jgi:hypothetical protein
MGHQVKHMTHDGHIGFAGFEIDDPGNAAHKSSIR